MINHLKLAAEEAMKIERMPLPWQFIQYASKFAGAEYVLGSENIFQTDCSGLVCGPLMMMGYNIRTTANDLSNRVFTEPVGKNEPFYRSIQVVFFRELGISRVTHVAPIVGRGVILDAVKESDPVMYKALAPVQSWYIRNGYEVFTRKISWPRVRKLSDADEASWGVDKFYEQIRRAV